jgi:hypothetical protein
MPFITSVVSHCAGMLIMIWCITVAVLSVTDVGVFVVKYVCIRGGP